MQIVTISGSTRSHSSNLGLLKSIEALHPEHRFYYYHQLSQLPIFLPESDKHPWPQEVLSWRSIIKDSDAVIISTPEYLHNIPAVLKNAFEWLSSSGEMMNKRILPITFTPHPPRGDRAMKSLLWTLKALKANIVVELPLYQSEIEINDDGIIVDKETKLMLLEAFNLLKE